MEELETTQNREREFTGASEVDMDQRSGLDRSYMFQVPAVPCEDPHPIIYRIGNWSSNKMKLQRSQQVDL